MLRRSRDYFLEGEHLESEYSGSNLQAKYFRGSSTDELVAGYLWDTDSKLKHFLFHHDNVTSTTAVSGHNGGTLQATTFSAFGNVQSTAGTSPNRLKYTGREDDGTGLYYYRARYYDPSIGRFISEDPLGFKGSGVNFYAYVGNNPVNGNDPTGLDSYYDIGSSTPTVTASGRNLYVQGASGPISFNGKSYWPSNDVPYKMGGAGHSGVMGPQTTATIINDIRSVYDGAPSGYLGLAVNSSYNGAPYDFKPLFDANKMWVIDGKAYRNDFPANLTWAGVAKSTGASLGTAIFGAKVQGFFANPLAGEDPRDTAAITRGYSWDGNPGHSGGASGSWAPGGASGS